MRQFEQLTEEQREQIASLARLLTGQLPVMRWLDNAGYKRAVLAARELEGRIWAAEMRAADSAKSARALSADKKKRRRAADHDSLADAKRQYQIQRYNEHAANRKGKGPTRVHLLNDLDMPNSKGVTPYASMWQMALKLAGDDEERAKLYLSAATFVVALESESTPKKNLKKMQKRQKRSFTSRKQYIGWALTVVKNVAKEYKRRLRGDIEPEQQFNPRGLKVLGYEGETLTPIEIFLYLDSDHPATHALQEQAARTGPAHLTT